jgi:hypothetical protein
MVEVAAAVAARPAGRISEVFADGSQREGAFRLMANDAVGFKEIAHAAHVACAARGAAFPFVFVPVDGTSLNIADWERSKGLGIVGALFVGARGLNVMSAIAVAPDDMPLGICSQVWWARRGRARRRIKHDRRRVESKETHHWLETMRQVRKVYAEQSPSTKPWFQLDRSGDAWPVLLEGLKPGQLFTVRAAHDRRLWESEKEGDDEPHRRCLWQQVESQPLLGYYELEVPPRPWRKGRTASIQVRTCEVALDLFDERAKMHQPARLWAVLAREEEGSVPRDEEAIEWLLLTTYPVHTLEDAQLVLKGYSQRWRIEEFHKIWKSGACRVEDTQLRSRERIIRWATTLASVAMRILRLTYLARKKPDLPATVELTEAEVAAIAAVKTKSRKHLRQTPRISEVVLWLAEIGGYTGKSSGGPPGPITIRRGLERIQLLAQYFTPG